MENETELKKENDGKKDDESNQSKKVELVRKAATDVKNSDKILEAFNPLRVFLRLYGRFPFQFKKRNGTIYLRFSPKSFGTVYFFVSSTFATIIFCMMITGFISMFFEVNRSERMNKCNHTWETWELKKYCVLVSLAVTWLLLTVIGSVFLISYGHIYAHFFNFWFKAVDIMAMDVSIDGVKKGAISGNVLMLSMVGMFICLYIYGIVPSLNEGSGSVANVLVRLFHTDIFYTRIQTERAGKEKDPGEYCGLFAPFDSYAVWKLFGFTIQLYAVFGSRIFIMQFRFFARILKNAVSIWNARLKYAFEGGKEDPTDQTKTRLDLKLLLKDHLILAQLFRMTETCFALIVQSFYFVQVANVGFQLYFFSQVGTVDTCEQYLTQLENGNSSKCQEILRTFERLEQTEANIIDIDRHICGDVEQSKIPNVLLALTLFVQTILLFSSTTNSASDAYEQALEGFGIVRRHGFMFTKSRKERNFIHCLVVSFARNNPMILSAAGYFIVSRPLTLVVIATVANYYIILLQFKPGEVGPVCDQAD